MLVDSQARDAVQLLDEGPLVTSSARRLQRCSLGPGETVAERYVVRRVLGEGGMGQVLEVEHGALGRAFALKVLRLEKWSDELVRRFNREARALARITTPRVAQVTDFGVDAQVGPFYVMELLEGETLEARIEREGCLPPHEALAIGAELCEALAEVHAAGIVHRDLKPSNVGLPGRGPVGVKLLDFGLAASVDAAFLSKITESQQILGSLPYMAPEQFNAAEPAVTMDVYALGVVLYESLTGRLPFNAPSTAALIHQILATPAPPLPPELPGRALLDPLLERLLAKEPSGRFASAAAAGQALRDVLAALGSAEVTHVPHTIATSSLGYLPTMPMPQRAPERVVPHESGTRLQAHAAPASPALATDPHAPPRPGPLRLLVIAIAGIGLAALAGVVTVVALSTLGKEGERAPAVAPSHSPAVAPVRPAPVAEPAAPPVPAQVAEPETPAQARKEQPGAQAPRIAEEPARVEPAHVEPATPRPRSRAHAPRRAETPPRLVEPSPAPIPPPVRPPPPVHTEPSQRTFREF